MLTSRLAADPALHVLLIEAGANLPPNHEPWDYADPVPMTYGNPRYAWPGLIATIGPARGGGRSRFFPDWVQGIVLRILIR